MYLEMPQHLIILNEGTSIYHGVAHCCLKLNLHIIWKQTHIIQIPYLPWY